MIRTKNNNLTLPLGVHKLICIIHWMDHKINKIVIKYLQVASEDDTIRHHKAYSGWRLLLSGSVQSICSPAKVPGFRHQPSKQNPPKQRGSVSFLETATKIEHGVIFLYHFLSHHIILSWEYSVFSCTYQLLGRLAVVCIHYIRGFQVMVQESTQTPCIQFGPWSA